MIWRTRLAWADLAPVELLWFLGRRAVRFGLRSGLVHYAATFTSAEIAENAYAALQAAANG